MAQTSDLMSYPTYRVSGILDTPEQLAGALKSLTEAGFPDEAVLVLCGEDAAKRIDASGQYHGISGRLTRATERLFGDQDEMMEAEEALLAGKFVVAVLAPSDAEVDRVRAALRANGAHGIVRFGRWMTTTLHP